MDEGWLFLEHYSKDRREAKGKQEDRITDMLCRYYVGFLICVLRYMCVIDQIG